MENFEMTLEVLGEVDEAVNFFKSYETETQKDLDAMRNYMYTELITNHGNSCFLDQ